jgi:predicted transglutaminase-like cysteine proteinase
MSKFKGFIAAAVAIGMAAFILAMPAHADQVDFTNPAFAPAGGVTSIPVGASEFCKSHRNECKANPNAVGAMALTEARWAELVQVNNVVNSAITAITDEDYYQVAEYWAYPDDGYGDCEDFALAKRKALIAAGWNPSTLLVTVVREAKGTGHAVLMVRTDRGDLVLDNQDGRILVWNETPYTYLKRQSQADAGQWVDLVDPRTTFVASK